MKFKLFYHVLLKPQRCFNKHKILNNGESYVSGEAKKTKQCV